MNDSMAFRCRRCGYTTNHKHSLVSHLQRKSPCVIIPNEVDEFPGDISIGTLLSELTSQKYTCRRRTHTGVPSGVCCPSCGRVFSFGSTLSRHRANCIKTRRENTEAEERDKKRDSELADLRKEVNSLLASSSSQNPPLTLTQNNNYTININAFGKEDSSFITEQMLDSYVRKTNRGLVDLVERLHFTTESNRNVRADVNHPHLIEYHDGRQWQYGIKGHLVKQIVDNGHEMISNHFDDHSIRLKGCMSHSMFEYVNEWMRKMEKNNHRVYTDVMAEVYVLILNRSREQLERGGFV